MWPGEFLLIPAGEGHPSRVPHPARTVLLQGGGGGHLTWAGLRLPLSPMGMDVSRACMSGEQRPLLQRERGSTHTQPVLPWPVVGDPALSGLG